MTAPSPVVSAPAQPARGSRLWRWIATVLTLIAAAVLIVVGVRWLASRDSEPAADADTSLEAQWDSTIRRLGIGIEPVYPPQEDLAVGDVFATVVADDEQFPTEGRRVVSSTPFLGKSVKLGHVDISKQLDEAYAAIPLFSETVASGEDASQHNGGGSGATAFDPDGVFGKYAVRKALPRAAFPGLTIVHSGSASAGITAGSRGWFDFGASHEASQKLVLGVVETYGLDAVTADAALAAYCKAPTTQQVCTEPMARKHLRSLLGDHVLDQFYDLTTKKYRYSVTVRLIMVSRVYLAREILEQWSTSGSEGGSAQAAVKADARKPVVASASGGTAATALEQRIGDVEKQLADLQQGGALVYRSASGTDILLDQKFPRPVAVGYRAVPFDFNPDDSNQPN